MSEPILVVEYEPRYTERVRQALAGKPFEPQIARDGEEALRALETLRPRLIVLSSVTPKVPTAELIRRIRANQAIAGTPILLTVSGYSGTSPAADAARAGATDILPKPYAEADFARKVEELLAAGPTAAPAPAPPKRKTSDDVDKLLADTLSGMLPKRTFSGSTRTPDTKKAPSDDFERMLEQTLSGLEKKSAPASPETPVPPPAATAAPAVEAQPVAPVTAPPPAAPEPEPEPFPEAAATVAFPLASVTPTSGEPPVPTSDAQEEDEQDGTRFGQYVLQERIAAGGMAEVWKARMRGVEGFQKTVAIKKILPHLSDNEEFVEMFIDEAKLAAQLSHNNIIHIYDLGKTNGAYFIAMEYVEGDDLRSILRRASERGLPMPVELSLFIASKVAAALDYAHRRKDFDEKELGLVHRDVSPQNVLISYEGDIKLCDFGIAKAASKASHTQAGALKGKLQYMSPEQAWGRPLDRRSDIFALGAVLFEMLTGRKLFKGDSEMSVLEQVREARIPSIAEFNEDSTPEIDAIVQRALMKEPADRYQSAGDMARELDQILYGFRPTPTSADLAIFMHRIYAEDDPLAMHTTAAPAIEPPVRETTRPRFESLTAPAILEIPDEAPAPEPEPQPVAPPPPVPVAPGGVVMPAQFERPADAPVAPAPVLSIEEEPRKGKGALIAVAAAILLALAAGAYYMMRPDPSADASSPSTQQAAMTPALPVDLPPVTPPPTEQEVAAAVAEDLQTTDQAAIEAEVQRRLEEARVQFEQQRQAQLAEQQRRLEEARRQQAAADAPRNPAPVQQAAAQPPPARSEPAPTTTVAQRVEPPAPTQTPAQQVETPAQTQTAAPQVAQSTPPPAQPAAPPTREGDLVPAGSPGLTGPEVIQMREPSYPPMGRQRRLEGTVILSALISETGEVIETRVLRSISPDLGFSNSAIEAVRGSRFRPAMKDGVRVRTYKTISVNFKL